MNHNYRVFLIIVVIFNIFLNLKSFAQVGKNSSEVYDLVPQNVLQIETDFTSEKVRGDTKLANTILNSKATDYSAPSITIRYGIIKNLEFQFITGYRAIVLNEKTGQITKNGKPVTISKNITGLSDVEAGFKIGIAAEKKLRPSIALTNLITIPNAGVPEFTANNPGFETDINFFNTLNKYSDLSYDLGVSWDGFEINPYPIWYYKISPELYADNNLSFFFESVGYLTRKKPLDNRLDIGADYIFNDNFESYLYFGTILYNAKSFFSMGVSQGFWS